MAITGSYTTSYGSTFANAYVDVFEGTLAKTDLYTISNFLGQAFFRIRIYEDITAYFSGKGPILPPETKLLDYKKQDIEDHLKWDGTTTVVAESSADELIVGDWIASNSDFQFFKITAIDGLNITIENPDTLTIPDSLGSYVSSCKSSGSNITYWRYFAKHILLKNGIEPIYQCEEYLMNEDSVFSGFSRV